ncbi:RrF2 family transcriptional regulator [Peribacillus acanthi]|uniref:RrF2 family transcriptional regulator n=1 Tax=Peribacillus acanthi TaxID=2171554 RepID=UPI000D3E10BD|nr:Rrf2 family transcriptional regulator [Peribacillus acanthi]
MTDKPSTTRWFGYAIQALVVLATYEGICPSAEMAGKLESRSAFLRKILTYLVKGELIRAKEGRDGGYSLARPADQITLADVYKAMQIVDPFTKGLIDVNSNCLSSYTNEALITLTDEMEDWILSGLEQKTIADMIPKK